MRSSHPSYDSHALLSTTSFPKSFSQGALLPAASSPPPRRRVHSEIGRPPAHSLRQPTSSRHFNRVLLARSNHSSLALREATFQDVSESLLNDLPSPHGFCPSVTPSLYGDGDIIDKNVHAYTLGQQRYDVVQHPDHINLNERRRQRTSRNYALDRINCPRNHSLHGQNSRPRVRRDRGAHDAFWEAGLAGRLQEHTAVYPLIEGFQVVEYNDCVLPRRHRSFLPRRLTPNSVNRAIACRRGEVLSRVAIFPFHSFDPARFCPQPLHRWHHAYGAHAAFGFGQKRHCDEADLSRPRSHRFNTAEDPRQRLHRSIAQQFELGHMPTIIRRRSARAKSAGRFAQSFPAQFPRLYVVVRHGSKDPLTVA